MHKVRCDGSRPPVCAGMRGEKFSTEAARVARAVAGSRVPLEAVQRGYQVRISLVVSGLGSY